MTVKTTSGLRHLKVGRFAHHAESHPDDQRDSRRGRWTGYRPLSEAAGEARLDLRLTDAADGRDEEAPR